MDKYGVVVVVMDDVECLVGLCCLMYILYVFYVIFWLIGGIIVLIVIIVGYVKCDDVCGMLYELYFCW